MRRCLVLAVLAAAACGGGEKVILPVSVASVSVTAATTSIPVGQTVQAMAVTKDQDGATLSGRKIDWTSTNQSVATVTTSGVVTAVAIGSATISATSENKVGQVGITVTPATVAAVVLSRNPATVPLGGTTRLSAVAKDAAGNTLARDIVWSTSDASKATVNPATGVVSGISAGSAVISATAEGVAGTATVNVSAVAGPIITAVSGSAIVPGAPGVTITGSNFSATPAANEVTIDGVVASVTAATPTQLTVSIPPATSFACAPTHNAEVIVTVSDLGSAPFRKGLGVALPLSLAVGQAAIITDPSKVRCNELPQTGGRYVISVFDMDAAPASVSAFQLRGAAGATTASAPIAAALAPAFRRGLASASMAPVRMPSLGQATRARADALHASILEENERVYRRLRGTVARSRRNAVAGSPLLGATQPNDPPAVGSTRALRVATVTGSNFCTTFTEVTARVAYVGSKSIIYEDQNAALKGTMDSYFQALGQEFDDVMFPILATNFGDPLAMDAQTDNNGRISMLFTPVVNGFSGLAGFVVSCDFFPRTANGNQNQSSNLGKFFYAYVPTSAAAGLGNGTKDSWRRGVRSVLIHEVKHITAFSERIARNASAFEESWLEEGTARHAEELFARSVYGVGFKGNTGYGNSGQRFVWCDLRGQSFPECTDRPVLMLSHYSTMYTYMDRPEQYSMFGRAVASDFTFYGIAWSFARWAADRYAASDAAFFKPLIQEASLTGLANISARTGVEPADMFGRWSLALYLDDYPGFPVGNGDLSFATWNTRDIFAGMNEDNPHVVDGSGQSLNLWPEPFPLMPRAVSFGPFSVNVSSIHGGTSSYFELSGTQASTQLIELRSSDGSGPAAGLRLAIARIQ